MHAVLQQGKYYSLNFDNFMPIPECDLVAAQEKAKKGHQHNADTSARRGTRKGRPSVGVVTPRPVAPSPPTHTSRGPSDVVRAVQATRKLPWGHQPLPTLQEKRGAEESGGKAAAALGRPTTPVTRTLLTTSAIRGPWWWPSWTSNLRPIRCPL